MLTSCARAGMISQPDLAAEATLARTGLVSCDHAVRCAGCPLIGLLYSDQLIWKGARLRQSLTRYPDLEGLPSDPVVPAEERVSYRTRAKLMAAPGGKLGLFAPGGGHQVVDIPSCRVVTPLLARVAAQLRAQMVAAEAPPGGALAPCESSPRGCLRAVDLRETRDGGATRAIVTLVVDRSRLGDLAPMRDAAAQLMRAVPEVVGVAVNFHAGDSPQVLGSETVSVAGVSTVPDRVGEATHLATFGSFVQAHRGQAGKVHALLVC